jgi:hypothetical protein
VTTLTRLIERLADYFPPFAARGVAASLAVWRRAAADVDTRSRESTQAALVSQTKRWRDLLLTGLEPMTLLPPDRFLSRAREVRKVLKAFWPELATGGGFTLLAALGAALLATGGGHRGFAALISVLGAVGATSSTLLAKAKSEAHDLIDRLRAAFDAELVVDAVTISPFPKRSPRWQL